MRPVNSCAVSGISSRWCPESVQRTRYNQRPRCSRWGNRELVRTTVRPSLGFHTRIFGMRPIAVLGTGMAGFGAGHTLSSAGVPFICLDRNPYYGGHTWSFRYDNGFVFDEGGHISFTKHDHIRDLLARNIDGRHEEPQLKIDNYWH